MSFPIHYFFNVLFICLICIQMPCAKCEHSMANMTTQSGSDVEFESPTEVNCGETQKMVDMCFKDLPPQLMEFLATTKIAVNRDDIISKCTVFKRGMVCFDRYSERCLSKKNIVYLQNNVAAARKFIQKLCDDRKFQTEYNRHKECFSHIQDEWDICTKKFQNILTDEIRERNQQRNITNKFMQFCCARHAYENCIYNSARFKCYKQSAKFARDTAKMLSEEKLFTNCRKFENLLCAAPENHQRISLIFLLAAPFVSLVWRSDFYTYLHS